MKITLISTDSDRVAFGMRSVSAHIKQAGDTLREAQILIEQWRQEYKHAAAAQLVDLPSPGSGGMAALLRGHLIAEL